MDGIIWTPLFISAEKDLRVMNFISYLNVVVLKNLEYQLYQNTIELDVAL